jgi:hypothetical protein
MSAPAEVTVGTLRTLLPEHKGNKRRFWTKIRSLRHNMQVSLLLSATPAGHIPAHEELNVSGHQSLAVLLAISVRKFVIKVAWISLREGNTSA